MAAVFNCAHVVQWFIFNTSILNLLIHFGEIYNVEPFPCLPGVNSHLHGSVSAMGLAKRKSWSCLKGFERFEIHNFAKKKAK